MSENEKTFEAYLKIHEETLDRKREIIISGAGDNADDAWDLFMKVLTEIEKRGVKLDG